MDSMEQIYKEHTKTVYGFLLSRAQQPDIAEELTQETFYRAVRKINSFKGESTISTWLCGIAKNVWLEYLKSQKKKFCEQTVYKEALLEEPVMENETLNSPEISYLLRWDNIQILKALHNLKEPMRETIYLCLIGNLTFKQIGEIMGKSENWARVTFYRGKEMIMKEVMDNES